MKSYLILILSIIPWSTHSLLFAHQGKILPKIKNNIPKNECFWQISTTSHDEPLSIAFYCKDKVIYGKILLCDLQDNPKLLPPEDADGYIIITDQDTTYTCYYKELKIEKRRVQLNLIN